MEDSLIRYKINQITDTGLNVSLALVEDVELETVSQQQLMLDAIDSTVTDKEVKQQIKPILEADSQTSTSDSYQIISTNGYSNYNAEEAL